MISGVKIKKLTLHKDKRGFFTEILKKPEKISRGRFAQLSVSKVKKGVIKAWHLHKKQTDWMCPILGTAKLALFDTRKKSSTYKKTQEVIFGEKNLQAVKIPPGVAHGYKVLRGPMYIIYITSRPYDPEDEIRIPLNDHKINYQW